MGRTDTRSRLFDLLAQAAWIPCSTLNLAVSQVKSVNRYADELRKLIGPSRRHGWARAADAYAARLDDHAEVWKRLFADETKSWDSVRDAFENDLEILREHRRAVLVELAHTAPKTERAALFAALEAASPKPPAPSSRPDPTVVDEDQDDEDQDDEELDEREDQEEDAETGVDELEDPEPASAARPGLAEELLPVEEIPRSLPPRPSRPPRTKAPRRPRNNSKRPAVVMGAFIVATIVAVSVIAARGSSTPTAAATGTTPKASPTTAAAAAPSTSATTPTAPAPWTAPTAQAEATTPSTTALAPTSPSSPPPATSPPPRPITTRPPTSRPSTSTPPSGATVTAVSVDLSGAGGISAIYIHVHVTTTGTGPVELTVTVAGSETSGRPGTATVTTTHRTLSGQTSYDVQLAEDGHAHCGSSYVGAVAAAGGRSSYADQADGC
jgi:hypothetical protein